MSWCKQIVDMYESGMSIKEITRATGRHPYRVLQRLCIEIRPRGGRWPTHGQFKEEGPRNTGNGYWRVRVAPDDPLASMRDHHGYVKEHRLALARKLRRPLLQTETVHHIDGDKSNNAPENLQLRHGNHGKGTVVCCADCGSRNIMAIQLGEES